MNKSAMLLVLPLLSACAIHKLSPNIQVARTSRDYNLQVEEAQDQNLLLNVWRAKERHPLYLTDIPKLSGSVKRDVTLGFSLPFSHIGTSSESFSPGATLSINPTFDVNVLYTQDFMRGFLSPISPATFTSFWRQGWPREFLIDLLVNRIEIYSIDAGADSVPLDVIENYPHPGNPSLIEQNNFGEWAHFLQGLELSVCHTPLLETLVANDLSSIDTATKAIGSGLSIVRSKKAKGDASKATITNNYKLTMTDASSDNPKKTSHDEANEYSSAKATEVPNGSYYDVSIGFDILSSADDEVINQLRACKLGDSVKADELEELQEDGSWGASGASEGLGQDYSDTGGGTYIEKKQSINAYQTIARLSPESFAGPLAKPKEAAILAVFMADGEVRIAKLYLRSPEGVLYYFGELARLEDFQGLTPRVCIHDHLEPIFTAYASQRKSCEAELHVENGSKEDIIIPKILDPDNPKDLAKAAAAPNEYEFASCSLRGVSSPTFNPKKEYAKFEFMAPPAVPPLHGLQCNGGRSMEALTLLSQLIGLQKAASDFPTTPSVRVIGQ